MKIRSVESVDSNSPTSGEHIKIKEHEDVLTVNFYVFLLSLFQKRKKSSEW